MTGQDAGEQEIVLRLSGITKRFGPLIANDAISLSLKRGEIVGLLGENGAGKTTLMNILFGHYVADEGAIEIEAKPLQPGSPAASIAAGVGMVHQHFTLADNLTVLDNIVLGTESLWSLSSDRGRARRRIRDLGQTFGLEVDPDATVATLSVGERQRVAILKALYREANILILDEPTAVLTPQESAFLFDTLKRFVAKGLSIIFISHKLKEILAACHRVAVLRGGKLVAEREVAGVTRAELAELMVGRAIPQAKAEPQEPGDIVLRLGNISARHASKRLDDITLELRAGEITGIAGVSGNGQSLLADVIGGVVTPVTGTITLDGVDLAQGSPRVMVAKGVARIPEDRQAEGLIGDMTVTENVISESYRASSFARRGMIDWTKARAFAEKIIADYEVKCPSPEAQVRLLSGGNMQKLILGRVMAGGPRVILANQPTRGLDVGAISYVHEQLLAARKRGAAVLLISEDLDELLSLADRIAVIYRGSLSSPMPRRDVTIQQLGLMMAGQGFETGSVSDAA
ncbi:MAG: ABC transporter ATP-binding protein [Rhizobiales bacterium]|nr:ABC transporter ATP-binding protein [Hyphomicrobiales bacterium]